MRRMSTSASARRRDPVLPRPLPSHVRIAIVGSGFSGLGAAIALSAEGYGDELIVLERRSDVGGTWHDNSYPGCRCDVPSNLYSFSFAPNPHWTETYSSQAEIERYLLEVARRFGVLDKVAFDATVEGASWDPAGAVWRLQTSRGSLSADILINGGGGLSEPFIPDFPGAASFAGTAFHSAAWDHSHDLTGRKVAIVGTGASTIQFLPEVQRWAGQRDPVPAHAALGLPPSQPPDERRRTGRLPAAAVDPTGVPGPQLLAQRAGAGLAPHPQQRRGWTGSKAGHRLPGPPGGRSGVAGQAHPDLPAGLQAPAPVQRLLPGARNAPT